MKNILFDIKKEIHESGILLVLLMFFIGFPIFLVECLVHIIFSPFVLFNEWSKNWFKG